MSPPNRDQDYLDILRRYYRKTRRIPSLARIGKLIGFSAPAAKKFVERLAAQDYLVRIEDDDAWVPAAGSLNVHW